MRCRHKHDSGTREIHAPRDGIKSGLIPRVQFVEQSVDACLVVSIRHQRTLPAPCARCKWPYAGPKTRKRQIDRLIAAFDEILTELTR